jgi:protein-S-isoprenylcysteine O-methyltransferase Ste14
MIVLAPVTSIAGRIWVNPPALDWAMLLVMAAGIAWCWWARLHLGLFWSANVTRTEGHHVVDTGPYRLVRHPIYTGFIVIYVGMAIICATALALLAVPVMTLGLWLKARVVDKFLIEELGASIYGPYRARTPMLLPRIQP